MTELPLVVLYICYIPLTITVIQTDTGSFVEYDITKFYGIYSSTARQVHESKLKESSLRLLPTKTRGDRLKIMIPNPLQMDR